MSKKRPLKLINEQLELNNKKLKQIDEEMKPLNDEIHKLWEKKHKIINNIDKLKKDLKKHEDDTTDPAKQFLKELMADSSGDLVNLVFSYLPGIGWCSKHLRHYYCGECLACLGFKGPSRDYYKRNDYEDFKKWEVGYYKLNGSVEVSDVMGEPYILSFTIIDEIDKIVFKELTQAEQVQNVELEASDELMNYCNNIYGHGKVLLDMEVTLEYRLEHCGKSACYNPHRCCSKKFKVIAHLDEEFDDDNDDE